MSRSIRQASVPDDVKHVIDCVVDARPQYGVCGCVNGLESTVGDNGARFDERTHFDHIPSDEFIRDEADRLSGYQHEANSSSEEPLSGTYPSETDG